MVFDHLNLKMCEKISNRWQKLMMNSFAQNYYFFEFYFQLLDRSRLSCSKTGPLEYALKPNFADKIKYV